MFKVCLNYIQKTWIHLATAELILKDRSDDILGF